MSTDKKGEITLVVKLDGHVWDSLTNDERQAWVDELVNGANEIGYVSDITIR